MRLVEEFSKFVNASGNAALNTPRKNGKTATVAAMVIADSVRSFRSTVIASIRIQNALATFSAIVNMATASGIRVSGPVNNSRPSMKLGPHRSTVVVESLDSPAIGHSAGYDIVVVDELGITPIKHAERIDALESATAARDGVMWITTIEGASPLWTAWRNRVESLTEWVQPDEVLQQGVEGIRIDDPDIIRRVSPGLGRVVSLEWLLRSSRGAIKSDASVPGSSARWAAQHLQIPYGLAGSGHALLPIVSDVELRGVLQDLPPAKGPWYGGIDLGGSWSLSALAAYWPQSGRLECKYLVPEIPDLMARGRRDGDVNRYLSAASTGRLLVFGKRHPAVSELLSAADSWGDPVAVGVDRYRRAEAIDLRSGWPWRWRGTGAGARADGSSDVRAFQRAVRRREIAIDPEDALMIGAVAASELRHDGAGNPALAKHQATSRIDPLSAAVIAVGLAAAEHREGNAWI